MAASCPQAPSTEPWIHSTSDRKPNRESNRKPNRKPNREPTVKSCIKVISLRKMAVYFLFQLQ